MNYRCKKKKTICALHSCLAVFNLLYLITKENKPIIIIIIIIISYPHSHSNNHTHVHKLTCSNSHYQNLFTSTYSHAHPHIITLTYANSHSCSDILTLTFSYHIIFAHISHLKYSNSHSHAHNHILILIFANSDTHILKLSPPYRHTYTHMHTHPLQMMQNLGHFDIYKPILIHRYN